MRFIGILLLLQIPGWVFSQITITGKIHDYDGKSQIYINHAREGIHPYFSESAKVTPQANGKFRYKFENPGIGIVRVYYRRIPYVFVHDESGEIFLEIAQKKVTHGPLTPDNEMYVTDSVRQLVLRSIDGDYRDINRYLNTLPRTANISTRSVSGDVYSLYLAREDDPQKLMSKLDSMRSIELRGLSNVLLTHTEIPDEIAPDMRAYLEDEIESFYASELIRAMFMKRRWYVDAKYLNPDTVLTVYRPVWEKMTEKLLQAFPKRIQRPNSYRYNELVQSVYYTLPAYTKYDHEENQLSLDEIIYLQIFEDSYHTDSLFEMSPKVRYAFQITNLRHFSNTQLFYSPVLRQAIDSMYAWHPGSEHLEVLQENFDKLDAYLETQESEFPKAVVLEENYTKLDGLLENFRGKTVLIDVWATWCHPCIGEFAYKQNLNDLIESGDLTVLYISIDKQRWDDRWRENLNYNRLKGFHVRADEVLIADMWNTLGEPVGAIPRYALVAPDGSIVRPNAARPSMGDQLRDQVLDVIGE